MRTGSRRACKSAAACRTTRSRVGRAARCSCSNRCSDKSTCAPSSAPSRRRSAGHPPRSSSSSCSVSLALAPPFRSSSAVPLSFRRSGSSSGVVVFPRCSHGSHLPAWLQSSCSEAGFAAGCQSLLLLSVVFRLVAGVWLPLLSSTVSAVAGG